MVRLLPFLPLPLVAQREKTVTCAVAVFVRAIFINIVTVLSPATAGNRAVRALIVAALLVHFVMFSVFDNSRLDIVSGGIHFPLNS